MTKSDWWHSATKAQKLAQIDGGIECGMTAKQVAMVSNAATAAVENFSYYHGHPFPVTSQKSAAAARKKGNPVGKGAYYRGEPVDFWQEPTPTNTAEVEEIRF